MTWRGDVGKLVEIRRIGAEELSVEWRIQDILSLPGGSDDSYLSTDFRFADERWRLRLHPNWNRVTRDPASGEVRLGLVKYDGGPRKVFHITVDIRGTRGVERSREVEKEFWGYDEYFWNDFCSRSEIMEQQTRLMTNDVFTITCVIKRVVPGAARGVWSLPQTSVEVAPFNRSQSFDKRGIVLDDGGGLKGPVADGIVWSDEGSLGETRARDCLKTSFNWEDAFSAGIGCGVEGGLGGPDAGFTGGNGGGLGAFGAGVNEPFKREVESLMKQNKDLDGKCEEKTDNNSKALYELRKDSSTQTDDECKDSKFPTEEKESSQKQAAFDTMVENNENNNDEGQEESKNKKNVKSFSQVKRTKKISFPTRHRNVIRSLRSILAGERRADFTLRSGSSEWYVHRVILEGRSPHFDSLFRVERKELRLDTYARDTLNGVLLFVYAGEVGDLTVENVCGMYVAAHEFLLDDLKSLCVGFMKERMCPEMVCDALAVAGTYDEGDLKKSAFECFFREANIIFETEGWKGLKENHPSIIAELCEESFKRERKRREKERDYSL